MVAATLLDDDAADVEDADDAVDELLLLHPASRAALTATPTITMFELFAIRPPYPLWTTR